MNKKEFERMLCDSLNDIIDQKAPEELHKNLHHVDTWERVGLGAQNERGVKITLNDGSIFHLKILAEPSLNSEDKNTNK